MVGPEYLLQNGDGPLMEFARLDQVPKALLDRSQQGIPDGQIVVIGREGLLLNDDVRPWRQGGREALQATYCRRRMFESHESSAAFASSSYAGAVT